MGWYLRERGQYTQAEAPLRHALLLQEQLLGPEGLTGVQALSNLALLYGMQGKYTEAEPLLQRALAIVEERLGNRHPDTLVVRKNYASLLHALGRASEAEQVEARWRGQEAEGRQ